MQKDEVRADLAQRDRAVDEGGKQGAFLSVGKKRTTRASEKAMCRGHCRHHDGGREQADREIDHERSTQHLQTPPPHLRFFNQSTVGMRKARALDHWGAALTFGRRFAAIRHAVCPALQPSREKATGLGGP